MSSNDEDEASSLASFKIQLAQVELSLEESPSNADLLGLKEDLSQLISLTESSLLERRKKELLDALEEEEDTEPPWEGRKVSAPFSSNLDGEHYHNAVVFSEDNSESVSVVFSHPILNAMKPCPHYLESSCRFEGRCKFSHGESIAKSNLRDYKEPDFSLLHSHPSLSVLAKSPKSGLWEHAKTLSLASEDGRISLEFSKGSERTQILYLEDVFPLEIEEAIDEFISTGFAPIDLLDRVTVCGSALGEWERHTKGIGSKLLAKMGFIVGTGLGKEAQGIREPVNTILYPQGKSLDYCMEQRNKIKTLDTRPKDAKASNKVPKSTVFDFINKSIQPGDSSSKGGSSASKSSSKTESDLKIENFQLEERISKAQNEIDKLLNSHQRVLKSDPGYAKGLLAKIDSKKTALAALKSQQRGIQKEQGSRNDRKKLSIF
eukprot:TRINITY_DN22349_c0_g1_i1.p1 TRINITY_DN22349_c0_g1~~TRINITY_DN22349_c0_g1_i1.p1  ORF type:complete len:433 (+),score=131.13 TRINITY_DN22349_c0_g1_i1:54-1352(+)